MARFSVGGAATAGFGVIGGRPVSTLTWGLVLLVLGFVPFVVLMLLLGGDLSRLMSEQGAMAAKDQLDPETLNRIMRLQSSMMLFNIGSWVWNAFANALVMAAVFRAVLEPGQRGFAYLRLGSRELWLTLLFLVGTVLGCIVLVGVAMAAGLAALVGTLSAKAGGVDGGAGLIAFATGAIALIAVVWLALRMSMAAPMTFAEGQFRLFESWTLTRGQGWPLLGVTLLVVIFVLVVEVAVVALTVGAAFGLGLLPDWLMDPVRLQSRFAWRTPAQAQALIMELAPMAGLFSAAWVLLAGMLVALVGAPLARIYADLTRPVREGGWDLA